MNRLFDRWDEFCDRHFMVGLLIKATIYYGWLAFMLYALGDAIWTALKPWLSSHITINLVRTCT